MKEIKLSNVQTIGDGSCFFHALFTIFSQYRDMTESEKKEYVYKFRRVTAKKLSLEEFCSLPMFESLVNHIEDKTPVYNEFVNRLAEPSEWADHYIISYTSHVIGLNVIVFDDSQRVILDEKRHDSIPKIYMLLINDSHFELLMDKEGDRYIF